MDEQQMYQQPAYQPPMYKRPSVFAKIMKDILPYIIKAITNVIYFVFSVIRYIFQEGMKMITNKYD